MNETQLYRYALFACCLGFFLLGFVVLFLPISFSNNSHDYIDGEVIDVFPSKSGGFVVIIKEIGEKSLFVEKNSDIIQGESYRFYNPTGDELLFVSDVRILS